MPGRQLSYQTHQKKQNLQKPISSQNVNPPCYLTRRRSNEKPIIKDSDKNVNEDNKIQKNLKIQKEKQIENPANCKINKGHLNSNDENLEIPPKKDSPNSSSKKGLKSSNKKGLKSSNNEDPNSCANKDLNSSDDKDPDSRNDKDLNSPDEDNSKIQLNSNDKSEEILPIDKGLFSSNNAKNKSPLNSRMTHLLLSDKISPDSKDKSPINLKKCKNDNENFSLKIKTTSNGTTNFQNLDTDDSSDKDDSSPANKEFKKFFQAVLVELDKKDNMLRNDIDHVIECVAERIDLYKNDLLDQINDCKQRIEELINNFNHPISENGQMNWFPNSTIKVSAFKHKSALETTSSFTAYISKMFFSLGPLEIYAGRNLKGKPNTLDKNSKKKKKFSPKIVDEIYKATEFYFKNDLETMKNNFFKINRKKKLDDKAFNKKVRSDINQTINKKLGKLNRHLLAIINKTENKELTDLEKEELKNYKKYSENPELLKELLNKIEEDTSDDVDATKDGSNAYKSDNQYSDDDDDDERLYTKEELLKMESNFKKKYNDLTSDSDSNSELDYIPSKNKNKKGRFF